MKKLFLVLAAAAIASDAYAEGYQVNNMSAKQTGMGHVGTAMKLNSESIFFNPAATAFQTSKFDISAGMTGILSNVSYRSLPTLETVTRAARPRNPTISSRPRSTSISTTSPPSGWPSDWVSTPPTAPR